MAYISPKVRSRLEELSPDLRSAVLAKNVPLRTLYDLIGVLEDLVREADG